MDKKRAIQISNYGGTKELSVTETELVNPVAGEVTVQNKFSGVNFIDIYMREGMYANNRAYSTSLPLTLGMEGAGIVVATGKGVQNIKTYDRVAYSLCPGTYADYTNVPAWKLVKLPDFIDFETAAALMLQGSTAHYLTHTLFPLNKDCTCLIHAGAGGVGQILIQLAKLLGATVLTTVGDAKKAKIVKDLGADVIIPYKDTSFYDQVMDSTNGLGVDVVYESVGKETIRESFASLKTMGTCVLFGFSSGAVTSINPQEMADAGSIFLTRPNLADYMNTSDIIMSRALDIFSYIKGNKLKLKIDKILPLVAASEAQNLLGSRSSYGKLLLRLD